MKINNKEIHFFPHILLSLLIILLLVSVSISFYLYSQNRRLVNVVNSIEKPIASGLNSQALENQICIHEGMVGNQNTFHHGYYGYYLEVPKLWRVIPHQRHPAEHPETATQFVIFKALDDEEIELVVWENIENLGLMEWYKKYQVPHLTGVIPPVKPNSTIAKREAVFTIETSLRGIPPEVTTVLAKDNLIFRVTYRASNNGSGKNVYTRMLETFGFEGERMEILDDDIPPISL
jgi:hypothetical protein